MGKVAFSILAVTTGMVIFTVLSNGNVNVPTAVLIVFLFLLHLALIGMVMLVLKRGKPPGKIFKKGYYEHQNF